MARRQHGAGMGLSNKEAPNHLTDKAGNDAEQGEAGPVEGTEDGSNVVTVDFGRKS